MSKPHRLNPVEHVMFDLLAQTVACQHCGASIPIPFGPVKKFCKAVKAFAEKHRNCKPTKDAK